MKTLANANANDNSKRSLGTQKQCQVFLFVRERERVNERERGRVSECELILDQYKIYRTLVDSRDLTYNPKPKLALRRFRKPEDAVYYIVASIAPRHLRDSVTQNRLNIRTPNSIRRQTFPNNLTEKHRERRRSQNEL